MKQHRFDIFACIALVVIVLSFFYKTFFQGLLPVPTDTLVGLYHPYRDAYLNEFTRGVPFKNFLITDPIRQQIPWKKQAIEYWKKGMIPSWDAWSFSGTTLVGNIQAGIFYPLNILFFLFSFPVAWTILIISQPLLSSLFMYLFLKNKQLEIIPSMIGSVCFAFGGYAVSWLTWGTIVSTFCWVPLALFAIDKIHSSKKKLFWRILFIYSIASSFFAGHIQLFIYGFLLVLWYSWWVYQRNSPVKVYKWHGLSFIILGIVTAPQWIPMIQFLFQTGRGTAGASWTHEGFFIPITHLVQFIAPDFFGNPATLNYWGTWNYGEMVGFIGVVGLVLAFFGIGKQTVVWIVPVVISLLFSLESPISKFPYQLHIPILSLFQPTRLIVIIGFSLSVLAAFGSSWLFSLSKKRKILILVAVGILFGIAWVSVIFPTVFQIKITDSLIAKRNLILPTGIFGIIVIGITLSFFIQKLKWGKISLLCLFFAISVVDLFRFGWKFTPFTSDGYFFPQTTVISFLSGQTQPLRVMVLDDRVLPPNVLSYYGIESVGGYDPLHSNRYEEFISAMERGEPNITPPFGFERIMTPKNFNSPLYNHLGVKYIISMNPINNPRFKKMIEEGETIVYKDANYISRVYLAQMIDIKTSKQEIINALYNKNFVYGVNAIIEDTVSILNAPLMATEEVRIEKYDSNRITINVTTLNTRLLVINNIFDVGWKAYIDGKKTVMHRANYVFSGIVVPQGIHTIDIIYTSL